MAKEKKWETFKKDKDEKGYVYAYDTYIEKALKKYKR